MKTLAGYAFWIMTIGGISMWEPDGGSHVFAATSSTGEVIGRCEDRPGGFPRNDGAEDDCASVWSEEFQEQYSLPADGEEEFSFRWAPYELTESELRLRYPPGARRPLWGY